MLAAGVPIPSGFDLRGRSDKKWTDTDHAEALRLLASLAEDVEAECGTGDSALARKFVERMRKP